MRRRTLVATGVFAGLLACAPLASADVALHPRSGCADFRDAAGDAYFVGPTKVAGPVGPSVTVSDPNNADYDLTDVSYRATDDVISVVAKVPGLSDIPSKGIGDTWVASFTSGKKVVDVKVTRMTQNQDVDDAYEYDVADTLTAEFGVTTDYRASVFVNGTEYHYEVLAGGGFDVARHLVTFSIARADLEAIAGPVSDITAGAVRDYPRAGVISAWDIDSGLWIDEAVMPAKQVVTLANNACF